MTKHLLTAALLSAAAAYAQTVTLGGQGCAGAGCPTPAPIAVLQSKGFSAATTANATRTLTFDAAAAAGNAVLVSIYYAGDLTTPASVTLSDGTTQCTQDATGSPGAGADGMWWYSCLAIPAGITGATVVSPAAIYIDLGILEVANLTTGFDRQSAGSTYATDTTWATAPVTPTQGVQALIVGTISGNMGAAASASAPYIGAALATGGYTQTDAYQVVTVTSGSYTPNGTSASAQRGPALAASYR